MVLQLFASTQKSSGNTDLSPITPGRWQSPTELVSFKRHVQCLRMRTTTLVCALSALALHASKTSPSMCNHGSTFQQYHVQIPTRFSPSLLWVTLWATTKTLQKPIYAWTLIMPYYTNLLNSTQVTKPTSTRPATSLKPTMKEPAKTPTHLIVNCSRFSFVQLGKYKCLLQLQHASISRNMQSTAV